MFKHLTRNRLTRLATFSQQSQDVVFNSFWMLYARNPEKGWRNASSVLIKRNLALTSAHNFIDCMPHLSKIVSPRTGQVLEIRTADIDTKNDIAILHLKGYSKETGAFIDKKTALEENLPVLKARMTNFNPANGRLELVKGLLISSEAKNVSMNDVERRSSVCSLFHMHSKPGDSGAGIFSQNGKLLTINNTGNRLKQASGTSISHIRKLSL